jgi:hypothetical protein
MRIGFSLERLQVSLFIYGHPRPEITFYNSIDMDESAGRAVVVSRPRDGRAGHLPGVTAVDGPGVPGRW